MELVPHIVTTEVTHKRLLPKENQFRYKVFYLALPLSELSNRKLADAMPVNRKGLVSFFEKDHGACDGSRLEAWAREILADYGLDTISREIMLVTIPRILNYTFNPVSFWMCFDTEKKLRAVLCEVNNTFDETHYYLCMHEDKGVINADDWLSAEKTFHVSPFLKREGYYKFRFDHSESNLAIWIDYYDDEHQKHLITALTGKLTPLNKSGLKRAFWAHPLLTARVITLIHLQALRLVIKGMRYISKPEQLKERLTITGTPDKKRRGKC